MATVTTDSVSRIAGLSDGAFAAFCEDIAGMFGLEMRCDRRQVQTMPVRSLREHFKKLTAVHLARADGALKGTFHLIFDQAGMFILSGVIVMLPESRIIEQARRGTLEDATNLQDAAREVGNLLIGSWDRVFREECPGHEHFVKMSTLLGKPWDKPEQIELQADAEVAVILYEMAIEPYPSFTCAAVFPRAVLSGLVEAEAPVGRDKPEGADKANKTTSQPAPTPGPAPPQPAAQKAPEPVARDGPAACAAGNPQPAKTPENTAAAVVAGPSATQQPVPPSVSAVVKENSSPGAADIGVSPPGDRSSASPTQEQGSKVIEPGRRSLSIDAGMLPSELVSARSGSAGGGGFGFLDATYIQSQPQAGLTEFLNMTVAEIMEKEVVWAGPEDTVQDVIAKMQQHNVGYVLIGANGVLEGLVSSSNILGAVSLYLRPMFTKWRRPQDDATLGVKVKWIMSRPVRTIRPDATLAAMIESMRRCGGRCLPVVDAKGAVQGIVTAFDILLRILESDKNVAWKGGPPQAPALLI